MERFSAFEDDALKARVERLAKAKEDLRQRITMRTAQALIEQRWLRSDPLYQHLSSVLRNVDTNLHDANQELLRRGGASATDDFAQPPLRRVVVEQSQV